MKKILFNLLIIGTAGLLNSAVAQDMPAEPNTPPPDTAEPAQPAPAAEAAPAATETVETPAPAGEAVVTMEETNVDTEAVAPGENGTPGRTGPLVIRPGQSRSSASGEVQSSFMPPEEPVSTNSNPDELRMNFRNAPLDQVLNYLSDAAGFIIVLEARVNGLVNVISSHPMTRDEAVDLLNSVLNKNGYAAIRDGRTLTIVDKNEAKTRNIPVKTGYRPEDVPKNAEIVTQIIPIRFVEARQLASDLTSFVSPQALVVANEAGNSIVITDTQSNIRHIMEIIRAIDNSAEAETEIRVFRLKHASPTDVATELTTVFPSSTGGSQSPISFGGAGGRGGGRGGGGGGGNPFAAMFGGGGGGGSSDRIKKATQVTAVADPRIQAVIVTAPKDLMTQIEGVINEMDVASTRDQKVYVFKMDNADPQQAVQVLQNMFQTSGSTRTGSSSLNSALQQRQQNFNTTSGSSSSSGFGTSSSSSSRNRSSGGGF